MNPAIPSLIICTLLLIAFGAQTSTPPSQYRVSCDNGFTTGWMHHASRSNDGEVVYWYENKNASTKNYVIPEGVTCQRERK